MSVQPAGSDVSWVLTRAVFVRALAFVYLVALISLWGQADVLFGTQGILPFDAMLERARVQLGPRAWLQYPTLLWLWPTDAGLHLLFGVGLGLAVAVGWGTGMDGPLLLGMWAVYLSLCVAGQRFLGFQWDTLLLECLFCAALIGQWLPGPRRAPPRWGLWLLHWVVFKLFFFGGLVKLTSGDPTWRDATALTYHYWTQPLPNPISWYADRLPQAVHTMSVWAMFAIELVVPFAVFAGAWARRRAFVPLVGLLGLLALTGNYGSFQLLGAVLCLTLLDDAVWRRLLQRWPGPRFDDRWLPARHLALPLAPILVITSLMFARGFDQAGPWGQAWMRWVWPLRTANSYGLFAVMTTERPVVVFEASWDGTTWEPVWPRWQTGRVEQLPRQVAPHMPRFDWQLWFAALGSCRSSGWVFKVQRMMVAGEPGVWGLFEGDLLADQGAPLAVRTTRWRYRFAEPESVDWWQRDPAGAFCPVVDRIR